MVGSKLELLILKGKEILIKNEEEDHLTTPKDDENFFIYLDLCISHCLSVYSAGWLTIRTV